jgi:hypothetical protein
MSLVEKEQLVADIHRLSDSIKRKHLALVHNIAEDEHYFEKRMKPIVEPLTKIAESVGKSELTKDLSIKEPSSALTNVEEDLPIKEPPSELAKGYMGSGGDPTFGMYYNPLSDGWYIGDKPVKVFGNTLLLDKKKRIKLSIGLYELLFKQRPDESKYKQNDLIKYKRILDQTNAHKDKLGRIKRNQGFKYKHIIRNLYGPVARKQPARDITNDDTIQDLSMLFDEPKVGEGMMIESTHAPTKYVYWNNVNELCDRLRTLISSKEAGHTGHDVEIASIVEELRENGTIIGGELNI